MCGGDVIAVRRSPRPAAEAAPAPLIAVLSLVVLTVAVLQTGVVPILGVMADQLNVSVLDISWAVTANLLAAAATTPLLGRLADLHTKKRLLVIVLVVVLAGSLLAAVTSSLAALVVARVLQGASFALYPIGISILRDELPPERLMRAMAVLSGVLGFGGGIGLVITGLLIQDDADYHRMFWFMAVFCLVELIAVILLVPQRPSRATGSVDWVGAAGLALGLSGLLLAITQGNVWGWTSAPVLGGGLGGLAVLALWWAWEVRCTHPLVSTAMLTRRPILFTNIATVAVGMGLYFGFLGLTVFVQVPIASGYGFGASVLWASVVFLLPGAFAGFVAASLSGRYIDRFGARPVLVAGAALGVAGFAMLALAHEVSWQIIAAAVLVNSYISLAYGALPALVVREVPPGETGVATSMNAIARTVGASMAAAVVAVLLARTTAAGYPPESTFTTIFVLGALTGVVAMVLIGISRPRLRDIDSLEDAESRALNHEWG